MTFLIASLFILSLFIPPSSNSWLLIWIGLEMNLILFIFICMKYKNVFSSESTMKYFLIQAIGSMLLLLCLSINSLYFEDFKSSASLFPPLALAIKSGMAPFHTWVVEIVSKLPVISIFLFLTIQKINPLLICFSSWSTVIPLLITVNIIVGSLMGINQPSFLKLLVFSSINNIGWLFLALSNSLLLFLLYFSVYSLLNLYMFNILSKQNIKWLLQINYTQYSYKLYLLLSLLSISGLPPLLGFFSKWLVIYFSMKNMLFLITVSIIFSVPPLFFYIKSILSSFTQPSIKKWNLVYKPSALASFFVVNFMGLIAFSLFF